MNCHKVNQSALPCRNVQMCDSDVTIMANIGGHIKGDIFENQLFVSTDHYHHHHHFTLKKLL